MTEATFIQKNQDSWKALEAINARVQKSGVKKLAQEEIREFARLFRLASHNLAYAKTHFPTSHILSYLNGVVGVTHNHFYVRERRTVSDIRNYFVRTFPRAVRESLCYWALAAAFLMIGVVFAGVYVGGSPERLHDFMPAGWGDGFVAGETPEFGTPWEDYSLMAASITTNNIAVTFNAIAGGLLAGMGTVLILIYNGLIIGALFGFFYSAGADMVMAYSLVLPHGIIELMAIFLAGGCGLMLAQGILLPKEYTRRQSLVMQAKKVAALLPGIVALLIVAGVIEGYFTPLPIDPLLKLAFAMFTGVGLIAYLSNGMWRDV